MFYSNTVKIYH